MSADTGLTKKNIDQYLTELGKEYRKLTGGKMDAEVIIVGGGAIVLNHDFREATEDLDAMASNEEMLKTAAKHVGDRLGLPSDWLNMDFRYTSSYSAVLRDVSVHYRTFSNHMDIRIIPDEYVIAMKLVSDRDYKHDHSDIVGILKDNADRGTPISKAQIESAVGRLYGNEDAVSDRAWGFLDDVMKNGDYHRLYDIVSDNEREDRLLLTEEMTKNPDIVRTENITDILEMLRDREDMDDDYDSDG